MYINTPFYLLSKYAFLQKVSGGYCNFYIYIKMKVYEVAQPGSCFSLEERKCCEDGGLVSCCRGN